MKSEYHLILHVGFGLLLYFFAINSWFFLLTFILFGFIINLDHLFKYFLKQPRENIDNFFKWIKKERQAKEPHFYIFHSIEFQAFTFSLWLLFPFDFILGITLAVFLHIITDMLCYIIRYKKDFCWINYFSILYYQHFYKEHVEVKQALSKAFEENTLTELHKGYFLQAEFFRNKQISLVRNIIACRILFLFFMVRLSL
ncbi:MAG: hypothetical protein GF308_06920 [Candidatus Heimdallarchaeota archaeon]|nr:hypothetical protein [Candidatus Heimdallarchaeota archaeon]